MSDPLSQPLAELTSETTLADISAEAVEHTKRSIRDFVGVAIYGSHHDVGSTVMNYVNSQPSEGDTILLGYGNYGPQYAALANGIFGHAVDYDDTFETIVLHPSGSAFPAALAAAGTAGKTGADVLTGYTVGLEVAYRVGCSVAPSHWNNGWHSTGTIGVFGATAAAASVLDLSVDQIQNAIGIAASSSAGLAANSGTMTKPYHSGHAAQMGIQSALMAQNGFTGNHNILEIYGDVYTVNDDFTPDIIRESDMDDWAVLDNGFKPYPSGVVTDAPMEALRILMESNNLGYDDVEKVTATVDERFEGLSNREPNDALQAKFSYEFCLAAILRNQHAGIHEFTDEFVTEDKTREAIDKVELVLESGLFVEETNAEASYGARVSLKTTDGETYTKEIRSAPGSPSNPLPDERLKAKFDECVVTVYGQEESDTLWEIIGRLDEAGSLDEFEDIVTQ